MPVIKSYKHKVASHCESGSSRNLLNFGGVDISEAMAFGIGSGVDFVYLSFMKFFSPFPLAIVRDQMGSIFTNLKKFCKIDFFYKKLKTTDMAIELINNKIDNGIPVAVCVDMFYMKYLPPFLQIHVPFHFVVLFGRDEDSYSVSDPYYSDVGNLSVDHLRKAISTHALFSNDNLVVYLKNKPINIDWKYAIKKALTRTSHKMNPGGFLNAPGILGVSGIKTFAKKMLSWSKKFSGLALREGILFTATGFEEQGTGGGAFRLLYGAFLQEASTIFNSHELTDLAQKMIDNGNQWREASRKLIKIGKMIPRSNKEFPDWFNSNKNILNESLQETSNLFVERANFEEEFFSDLLKLTKKLPM